jgi:hypothetical protein
MFSKENLERLCAECVQHGTTFLDQIDPHWWRHEVDFAVNLESLNMSEIGSCLLAQRTGIPYDGAVLHLGMTEEQGKAWGFDAPDGLSPLDAGRWFAMLTDFWCAIIADRRHKARVEKPKKRMFAFA